MYRDRCAKLEKVADKARELVARVKSLESELKAKDETNRKIAGLLKQEREDHNVTKDKLMKMGEKARQILTKSGDISAAQYELKSDLNSLNGGDLSEIKTKHRQEVSKLQEELDRERKLRLESERKFDDVSTKLESFKSESEVLNDTIQEQKALIARLENGLSLAMDQLDYLNSQAEVPSPGNRPSGETNTSEGISNLLGELDTDSMDDPEVLSLLAEVLVNNRQSMALGDLGELFQRMDDND